MELEIINPLTYPGWDDLLLSQTHYSFFHTSHWARVLHESYGYTPVYIIAREKQNVSMLLPFMEVKSIFTGKRGVSLPFTDSCEPLLTEGTWTDPLLTSVAAYGEKAGWNYLEMRDWPKIPERPVFAHYYGHSLDLSRPEDIIINQFRDSTRRNIKKGEKEGVSTTISTNNESMEHFRRMNLLTRKKHGLPPQPDRFFKKVYDHIIAKGFGIIVLASYKGDAIAGSIFFHIGGKAIYKYGASDQINQHLRANNLVMWEGIRWYIKNGYRSLSFGRTEPQNDGLRQFKVGWGAEERTIKYYRYDLKAHAFMRGEQIIDEFYHRIFSIMPKTLLKLSGRLLYRHMG